MAFRLETFGGLALLSPPTSSSRVHQRQRLAFLALLAASERGLSRDQVIAFLWPDKPDDSARHSLDQLLYALRRALGSSAFEGVDPLRLNDAVVTSDVGEFARALGRGALAEACAFYRGPFLDGFFLGNGSEFEEWLDTTRAGLATQYRSALAQLASQASAAGHLSDAVRWWRDLSAADPLSGRVALGLMRALAAAGDRAAALQHARVHESIVGEQLGTAPDGEVTAFVTELRTAVAPTTSSKRETPETESGSVDLGAGNLAALGKLPAGRLESAQPETRTSPQQVLGPPPAPTLSPTLRPRPFPRRKALVAGVVAFAVLVLSIGAYTFTRTIGVGPWSSLIAEGAIGGRERVILADFGNATSDSLLNRVVTEALRVDLAESRILTLMDPAAVGAVLQRMERPADEGLSSELAREAAIREGIKAVIEGEVGAAGAGYLLIARIVAAQDGTILAYFREPARDENEFIRAIDALSESIRKKAGESLADIRESPPLAQATTASLEALRLYTQALAVRNQGDYARGVTLLEEAIALDPQFGLAWRSLANSSSGERRVEASSRAYHLRDRLPRRERLLVTAFYFANPGPQQNQTLGAQIYQNLIDAYPEEAAALNNLGDLKRPRGDLEGAIVLFERAAASPGRSPIQYANLVTTLYLAGREEEATSALERLVALFPEHPNGDNLRFAFAYHRRRWTEADSIARYLQQRGQVFGGGYRLALTRIAQGRLEEAAPYMRERAEWTSTQAYNAALDQARIQSTWLSDTAAARRTLAAVLARHPLEELDVQSRYLDLAEVYARLGDTRETQHYLARHEATFPLSTQGHVDRGLRAGVLGHLALANGDHDTAVQRYRDARRLTGCAICYHAELGLALLGAGEHEEAATQLEAAATDRWFGAGHAGLLFGIAMYRPLVHEGLGELYEVQGLKDQAAAEYDMVAELWKDADHPVLQSRAQRAREKAAALRGNRQPE